MTQLRQLKLTRSDIVRVDSSSLWNVTHAKDKLDSDLPQAKWKWNIECKSAFLSKQASKLLKVLIYPQSQNLEPLCTGWIASKESTSVRLDCFHLPFASSLQTEKDRSTLYAIMNRTT